MDFEFDPAKSDANHHKHGIDFVAAQELWAADGLELPALFAGEVRLRRIAPWKDRLWTAVYTMRGTRIRLISVRRARMQEVEAYEQASAKIQGTNLEP
jgi:hypothetical protein